MDRKVDPRVTRTRRLLIDALKKLIIEEGIESLTIREIVRAAEVNRSTFYLHFRDKQDIVEQMQDDLLNELAKTLEYPTYTFESALQNYIKSKQPIKTHVDMLIHIQKNESLYRIMLADGTFRKRVTKVMIDEVFRFKDGIWEASFMANGSVGMILYWLENGMKESIYEMSIRLTRVLLFPLGDFQE